MGNYIEIDENAWASIKQRDPNETIYMINLLKFRDTVEEGLGVDGRKGRDVWMNKYGAGVNSVAERLDTGLEVVFLHDAHSTMLGLPSEEWDMVAIVRYRTRANFIEMIEDEEYQRVMKYRNGSLENSRLIESVTEKPNSYPTSVGVKTPNHCVVGDAHPQGDQRIKFFKERSRDKQIFMLNLIRFVETTETGLSGDAGYELYKEAFGMFAEGDAVEPWVGYPLATVIGPQEEAWDTAFLVDYPSRERFREIVTSSEYRHSLRPLRQVSVRDSRLVETTPVAQ